LKKQDGLEETDIELENIVGNLMIAEYQVNKLRDRVTDKIDARYLRVSKEYLHIRLKIMVNGKWDKISINVEEIAIDKTRNNVDGAKRGSM
jgi:hypothetical protein